MISESNSRTTLTPNWLSLMNTSVDNLPFEVKLDKAKISFDPATIKFLPLILKTLKKNKYFDKIIEEPSTQNPLQDKREPMDNNIYDKNIFSDTRNWMRMPTSRLYAIEYKTSPIVYFKNPTRNIDYFKKVRKIRDYQRIMNYVDKMISERVTFGSTLPMNKIIYNKHKNSIITDYTTPMTKVKEYETKKQITNVKKPKIISSREKPHCSCPKRMNELLNKLIMSLQKLLPNFTDLPDKSSHTTKPCKHNSLTISETPRTSTKPKLESSSKSYSSLTANIAATVKPYRNQETTTALPKLDYTLNSIIALLKPSILKKDIENNNLHLLKTTTTKNYAEGTDGDDKLETTTETMKDISAAKLSNSATTIRDYILSNNSNKETFLLYPKEYEDYVETTPKFINNYAHDLELVKTKINFNTKGQIINRNKDEKRFSDNNIIIVKNSLSKTTKEPESYSNISTSNNSDVTWDSNRKPKPLNTETVTTNVFSNSEINLKKEYLTNSLTENNKIEQTIKSEDITLEEEIEKTVSDDVTAEENLKNLENIIKTLNNSDIYNQTTTEGSELYEWELINIEENYDKNDIFSKSMIPLDKASYLEIQRNDWKQDEQQDYDNNINHYLFE